MIHYFLEKFYLTIENKMNYNKKYYLEIYINFLKFYSIY